MICDVLTLEGFCNLFHACGRGNQFSYDGLTALFNYLEEVYHDSVYDADPIGLCCDFCEYSSEAELLEDHPNDGGIDGIRDVTTVLDVKGGGYIIQNF